LEVDAMKIWIDGMSCEHCRKRVERQLEMLEEVRKVSVDLDAGIAFLSGAGLAPDRIVEAIKNAGYEVREIEED
jgi:Cu+-exporting ATPase